MKINKTYKFKLQLNSQQVNRVSSWIGACRVLYNLAKETSEISYQSGKPVNYYSLAKQLTELRKEVEWINDVPVHTCQDVIERYDKAMKNFFSGRAKYPRWAKKGQYNSITLKSVKQDSYNRLKLPKLGSIKYFASQEIKGQLRRATITKEVDGYYISVLTQQELSVLPNLNENQAGIDMGISFFAVTSDGEYIDNQRFLKTTLPELRRQQRKLSRKIKRSNNWYKQLKVVQRLHKKVSNQRKDFLHKLSTRLVKENGLIAIESLNIKGMVKSRLAQAISDVAWGEFHRQLEYKASWYGSQFEKVDAKYTSQECSKCGHIAKGNRLTQSQFKCVSCGHSANADEDASKVILGRAMSTLTKRKAVA